MTQSSAIAIIEEAQQDKRLTVTLNTARVRKNYTGVPHIPTNRKKEVQPMGISKKKQAAIANGLCYICLENQATVSDGYGGKLCTPCLANAQQILFNHATSQAGYRRRARK